MRVGTGQRGNFSPKRAFGRISLKRGGGNSALWGAWRNGDFPGYGCSFDHDVMPSYHFAPSYHHGHYPMHDFAPPAPPAQRFQPPAPTPVPAQSQAWYYSPNLYYYTGYY